MLSKSLWDEVYQEVSRSPGEKYKNSILSHMVYIILVH